MDDLIRSIVVGFICFIPGIIIGCIHSDGKKKTGTWEETEYSAYDDRYRCSACGEVWEFIKGTPKDNGANYCPHCGARMESA